MVAFQDTEAFDSGLLSDLILLLNSWRDRLQFTLLFGIATSVELFQARLLKSTAQHLFGGQFDVVQASAVLDSVFKAGVAHADVMLRLGPTLLRGLIERQQEQVAGIQAFISSLKVGTIYFVFSFIFAYFRMSLLTSRCLVCLHVPLLRRSIKCATYKWEEDQVGTFTTRTP